MHSGVAPHKLEGAAQIPLPRSSSLTDMTTCYGWMVQLCFAKSTELVSVVRVVVGGGGVSRRRCK